MTVCHRGRRQVTLVSRSPSKCKAENTRGKGRWKEEKRGSVGMKREEEMKGGGTGGGKGDLKRENKSSLRFK